MGCCRTIETYNVSVQQIIQKLQTPSPVAVVEAVDGLRDVLGNHQIDHRLASKFRREVEPTLATLYSEADLYNYGVLLIGMARQVQGALHRWSRRYCGRR